MRFGKLATLWRLSVSQTRINQDADSTMMKEEKKMTQNTHCTLARLL